MKIILSWIVAALSVLAAAYVLPGVSVSGFGLALVVALVLGVVNAFVRPLLLLLTLPLNLLTFGLLTFVINALLVLLVSALVPGFEVGGFWMALLFSLVLSVVSTLLHGLIDRR
ncbi:MAG: phage holin family protein [bacterium]